MPDADSATEDLYHAHYQGLVRLAVLLVRDHGVAEDVVQDAFVTMHGRWHRLADPDKALAYLRVSVVNRCRSVHRHQAVVDRHRPTPPAPHPGAEHATLDRERRESVLDAMRGLARRQREVLALRYYLDYSEREIAEALGISQGAVKSHASRGVAALRVALGPLFETPLEDRR